MTDQFAKRGQQWPFPAPRERSLLARLGVIDRAPDERVHRVPAEHRTTVNYGGKRVIER